MSSNKVEPASAPKPEDKPAVTVEDEKSAESGDAGFASPAMTALKDLAAPFTDMYCARVEGTLLGIQGTKVVVQALYWMSVLFGTTVFVLGVASTFSEMSGLVTTTEILPMKTQVNFPVVYFCLTDMVASQQAAPCAVHLQGHPDQATCESIYPSVEIKREMFPNVTVQGAKSTATDDVVAMIYHTELEKKFQAGTATPAETNGYKLIESVIATLDENEFAGKACAVLNYDQEFKPRYDSKMKMMVGTSQVYAVTNTVMYGIVGFAEFGVTDAKDTTYSYMGYQNVFQTFGLSIDEQVEARGLSWMPKGVADGKKSEVYRINSAISTAMYQPTDADTVGPVHLRRKGAVAVGGQDSSSMATYIACYMDTFVSRRTVIRNKALYEIFMELGASFAASLLFITALFTESGYITQHGIQAKVKIFRFQDTASVLAMLKEEAKAKAVATVAGSVPTGELQGAFESEADGK